MSGRLGGKASFVWLILLKSGLVICSVEIGSCFACAVTDFPPFETRFSQNPSRPPGNPSQRPDLATYLVNRTEIQNAVASSGFTVVPQTSIFNSRFPNRHKPKQALLQSFPQLKTSVFLKLWRIKRKKKKCIINIGAQLFFLPHLSAYTDNLHSYFYILTRNPWRKLRARLFLLHLKDTIKQPHFLTVRQPAQNIGYSSSSNRLASHFASQKPYSLPNQNEETIPSQKRQD
jgi:hypothetical protein